MNLTQLRKETLEKLKDTVIKNRVVVFRQELQTSIEFNVAGIKECINQPCSQPHIFMTKMRLIADDLVNALTTAHYVGFTNYQTHPKPHVVGYHYFETQVGAITLYFNVQLTVQKKLILYSITERVHI